MLKMIGYLTLGILLVLLGMYLGGVLDVIEKSDLITKHPTIFVGSGAAIAALIGVFISQAWQSVNINKQLLFQKEQYEIGHKKALELKDKELSEQKKQKLYDSFEEDKKKIYFDAIKLRTSLLDLVLTKHKVCITQCKLNILQQCFNFPNIDTLQDYFLERLREYKEGLSFCLNECNQLRASLTYLSDTKNIGTNEYYEFKKYLNMIDSETDKLKDHVESSETIAITLDMKDKMDAAFDSYDVTVDAVVLDIITLYNSDAFIKAFQDFLNAIKLQKIEYGQ